MGQKNTKMQNKLFFAVSLTSILYWVDSSPIDFGLLESDNLNTDISDLKYEGGLDDFFKPGKDKEQDTKTDKPKTKINTSGFRKKKTESEGLRINYDIDDLKKFLQEAGLRDVGSYNDGAIYAIAKGIAAAGIGVTGDEERKYRKGIKTKGFHKVSHKDEYEKDKEFYNDDETSGVIKKVGAKGLGFGASAGAGVGKGYFKHERAKGLYGKKGFSDKGSVNKDLEAYDDSDSLEAYFNTEDK